MKKRILALAGMAATMIFGMSLTSFAAEEPKWIVPKGLSAGEYQSMYGTPIGMYVREWRSVKLGRKLIKVIL